MSLIPAFVNLVSSDGELILDEEQKQIKVLGEVLRQMASGRYTRTVDTNATDQIVFDAGVLAKNFDPTGETPLAVSDVLGLSTGGFTFATNPTYEDWAEDVDQLPNNTKEFKRKTSEDPTLSGTFVTLSPSVVMMLMSGSSSGDVYDSPADSETDPEKIDGLTKITPQDLASTDFTDIWLIGDVSDGGSVAIHLYNALNTAGFQITTSKNAKAQFAFEFHGHYTIAALDQPPYEIYFQEATE